MRTVELVEEATKARVFRPRQGATYVVTGVPVVTEALADAVQSSILVLLVAAVLLMAATLTFVFRTRLRLLPLVLALAAAAVTFGALSLAGGSLTMASIAVLPVLIGLAVDYAIQFQARFDEQRARRRGTAAGQDRAAALDDAVAAATAGGPTIVAAGAATAVGFLVLLLSPVPMVRGFGLLLVLGIAVALVLAICAGFATLVRFGGRAGTPAAVRAAARAAVRAGGAHPRMHRRARVAGGPLLARAGGGPRAPAQGAGDRARGGRARAGARHPERGGVRHPAARAAGPPGAARRERAAGGHRRVRRDRRGHPRGRHHPPGGAHLDDALPERRAARPRLPGGQALHPGARRARALPGPVASRPLRLRRRRPAQGPATAPPGAALPLSGRDHARPEDRQPGLRDPADAARPPEGGGGRHQGAARPAGGGERRGGGPAGAGRGGQRRAARHRHAGR